MIVALVLAGVRPALPRFRWAGASELFTAVMAAGNLLTAVQLGVIVLAIASLGVLLLGGNVRRFVVGFPVVYALAWVAQLLAGNTTMATWGLEYVIFGLVIGLVINQTVGLPHWLAEAVRTEYYIKIGLVVLGAGILFGEMVEAGLLGITQAVFVVIAVWFVCFHLAKRLRVDDEFAVMLSTAVSICGVSAAIAACGAIQGDRKKLSYVTSLVLVVAVPMLVLMPWAVRAFGIDEVVAGAWVGGTLDTSAAVVAAGELIGPAGRNAAVVVKLSQNALIGVAAFLLTMWWAFKGHQTGNTQTGLAVVWERFPKFVLGFLLMSFLFSFVIPVAQVTATRSLLTGFRTVWFALAFVSIGLETRFGDLVTTDGGRPLMAFLGAQTFNVLWTLLIAYLLFGGVLFPVPAFK